MIRPLKIAAVALAATALLTGVAYAAPRAVPKLETTALQNPDRQTLPGDIKAVEQLLAAGGPVRYKLLVIESNDGYDKTDYIDRVATEWGQPAKDTLLLVIYTGDNYDLRFYMGADFRARGVSVDEMLQLVRGQYFARVHQGDVAGGLDDLISAVNQRMGAPTGTQAGQGGAPAKKPVLQGLTVPAPIDTPRMTAVDQLQIAKAMLTTYLSQFTDLAIPEVDRLQAFRWDDNKLHALFTSADELEFRINYDVLPASPHTAWSAGTGSAGDNGWIADKSQFMLLKKVGDGWHLQGFATSPAMRVKY